MTVRGLLSVLTAVLAAHSALGDLPVRVGGMRTLVILEDGGMRQSHSQFFGDLEARGHKLTFASADDSDVSLSEYGVYSYDNIVIFAPTVAELANVEESQILQFIDDGGNALLVLSSGASDAMRELAQSCGVEVDDAGTSVIDHIRHVADSADHTVVYTSEFAKVARLVGPLNTASAPVLFRGVGLHVSDDNILALRVLTGSDTAYSANPGEAIKDYPQSAGRDVLLVAAVQARNNARVLVAGSVDMFSNEAFASAVRPADGSAGWERSSNRAFAQEVTAWNFAERGVLRARDITHHRSDGRSPETQLAHKDKKDLPTTLYPDPEIARDTLVYRIKDDLTYSVTIEEFAQGGWQAFAADDVQLEFIMLDPYVRKTMTHDGKGRFSVTFKVPDVYGIYKFRIMYRRPGLSTLEVHNQVSVRPFRHNEYERFILSAYPYYTASFAMMGSFFVFGWYFLYHKDDAKVKKE